MGRERATLSRSAAPMRTYSTSAHASNMLVVPERQRSARAKTLHWSALSESSQRGVGERHRPQRARALMPSSVAEEGTCHLFGRTTSNPRQEKTLRVRVRSGGARENRLREILLRHHRTKKKVWGVRSFVFRRPTQHGERRLQRSNNAKPSPAFQHRSLPPPTSPPCKGQHTRYTGREIEIDRLERGAS